VVFGLVRVDEWLVMVVKEVVKVSYGGERKLLWWRLWWRKFVRSEKMGGKN
jgi:hypothetical protein